jgi:Protein of unknown function (DUF763)
MARRAGSADLPLHGGHVPRWLADRMTRLGAVTCEAIVHHYGRDELLRRLAHNAVIRLDDLHDQLHDGRGRNELWISLLNDYGVAYSTNAVTWGRTPVGGFNWTDAAWSSAFKK